MNANTKVSYMNFRGGESQRKESFDTLKSFLAFFIIIIHTGFTGVVDIGASAISRMAVPLFFMITGYYLPTMTDEKIKKYFCKVVVLTVISTAFYLLFTYAGVLIGEYPSDKFTQIFSMQGLRNWVLINAVGGKGIHLWYLYALLYVLIIIYITRKVEKISLLYKILPILFIGNYIFSYFSVGLYRNFLFTGLPYVLLGYLFRENEAKLKIHSIKSRSLILGFVAVCMGLGIEMLIYNFTGTELIRDHYLFTLPMAICVFALSIKHPHYGSGSLLSIIGKKYSAHIYIMHIFVVSVINFGLRLLLGAEMQQQLAQNSLFKNSFPFLVFGVTLFIVFILDKSWSLFMQKKQQMLCNR